MTGAESLFPSVYIERIIIMEFNEKLQELRKQKGLTQEELAEILYVSRAAVSKWESGRGYPNIESLKAIARFFGITIDDLLSGDELLNIAETETQQREKHYLNLVFGLLDCSVAIILFLPFFGQRADGVINEVSLLQLTLTAPYLKALYLVVVTGIIASGILTLILKNSNLSFWNNNNKSKLSMLLNIFGVGIFIIGQQPYAAVFMFAYLIIKTSMLIKWR